MNTNTKLEMSELLPSDAGTSSSEGCIDTSARAAAPPIPIEPILPVALQDTKLTDLTEGDVELLLRVARDKNAPAGRYKGVPKKIPEAGQK